MSEYSWPSGNGSCQAAGASAAWPETVRSLSVGTSITGEVIVGQTVTGRVTKIVPIGFFVRIADCVEGLVPLTEPVADIAKVSARANPYRCG
ncbi:S1 RNA-binding domain-containing protein [Streptomyces sp. WAC 01529]|uniref:S1 RNA-binding domain-containing protein n=1 Tax=Streptomyces sp. WAC 01529 TaxID=2203205 RepID=UPI001F0C012C|nr:S1 RNA-binding domain-containing protein [Streptomyces sp. WAC 01529]